MKRRLVIVESPAKARAIGGILGKDYEVLASIGHVRDLPKKEFGVDIENGFAPKYVAMTAKKVLPKLKKASAKADLVYLAPDPDREGEAIAWHLKEALKLPDSKIRRVTFHEITPRAVKAAFQKPGKIDMDKVNAQQARRILDRIVGYKISPILWKKITKGLSAGRVQSVALRFIVDREKEIQAFVPQEYWRISARFDGDPGFEAQLEHRYVALDSDACPECGQPLKRRQGAKVQVLTCTACKASYRLLPEGSSPGGKDNLADEMNAPRRCYQENVHIASKEAADRILSRLSGTFTVASYETAERESKAPPPFMTSTLQQAASNELGFSATRTMKVAQQLYEGVEINGEITGLITYMRTDSFNVAASAVEEARDFISKDAGPDYLPEKPNYFKSRASAQAAHEAIRPTSVLRTPESLKSSFTAEQFKIYSLIWRRFLASQCRPALYNDQKAELRDGEYAFRASGRVRLFDGAERYWPQRPFTRLPTLQAGAKLQAAELKKEQFFTEPPARYSEAALIKTLEKEGIGRPSTYATIVSTLLRRGYVVKQEKRFHPTELGILVAERLLDHFPHIMDVGFTAQMETALDKVEEKERDWLDVLKEFWADLEPALKKAVEEMKKSKAEVSEGAKCPECGGPMVVRMSRRGKFLGCQAFPKCRGRAPFPGDGGAPPPRFKAQPTGLKCPLCGKELLRRMSRRGPFIGCSGYPNCRFTQNIETDEQKQADEVDQHGSVQADE
jgi:DNA topoisomerase-1